MATPTQMDEAISRNKKKAVLKRIERKILKTIETHNKVFVSLNVNVVSYDNIIA